MGTMRDLPKIVELAPGTTVELADGTIVELAAGTVVELAPGTAVGLEPGTVVELAPGTTVELASGTAVSILENLRQRILKDPTLTRGFTWLDFGTKNQRISTITYSATGETESLLRTFGYTLDGTKYKLSSDIWSVV